MSRLPGEHKVQAVRWLRRWSGRTVGAVLLVKMKPYEIFF